MSARHAAIDAPAPARVLLRDRLPWLDGTRLDVAVAAAIVIELVLECSSTAQFDGARRAVTPVAIALFGAAIALRRRWPAGALVSGCAIVALQAFLGGRFAASNGVAVLVGVALLCYSAVVSLPQRRSLIARALGMLALSAFVLSTSSSFGEALGAALFVAAVTFAAPSFIGYLARERVRRAAALRELERQVGVEQLELQRAAIAEERARIGRELQDIVAHSVSAMVIQAGAARQLVRNDPARARTSIATVERTGREALADLRRMLGVLRKEDDPRTLAPQPGLDRLPTLIESVRLAGVDCDVREQGESADLTPGVDLVAYRVIEATLASAVRHSCAHTSVTIRRDAQLLELELRGDDAPPDLASELTGIRERVALYDGSLRSLPADDGGFAVRARLPLKPAVAT